MKPNNIATYRIKGLHVRTEVEFSAERVSTDAVDVYVLEGRVGSAPPDAKPIDHVAYGNGSTPIEARQDVHGRIWVAFADAARFCIEPDLIVYEQRDGSGLAAALCETWAMDMLLRLHAAPEGAAAARE